jgi:polysaccharide export outer membrane protein
METAASRRPLRSRGPGCALALLLTLGLAACAGSGGGPPGGGPDALGAYRVGPPDQLQISILPDPVIEREVVVRPDGMISVDLVGDIPATGRTTEEIAADIESRIGRFKRDARVTVALGAALSSEVTVLGEVGRASTFPLARQTRVVEAIGTVGGTTVFANKDSIRLIRSVEGQKAAVYKVDLAAIQRGDMRTNYVLQGGDLLYVPPGAMASVGYAVQALLFPFQQLFGFGTSIATTVYTGGI